MDKQALEREAIQMSPCELKEARDWNVSLAAHFADNMDQANYDRATLKLGVIENELRERGIIR